MTDNPIKLLEMDVSFFRPDVHETLKLLSLLMLGCNDEVRGFLPLYFTPQWLSE